MKYTKGEILLNDEIQTGIYKMVVKDKNKAKAGQFYMLKHNGTTLLPRPISVCETNGETLTFVYAVVGNGTKEYAELKVGDIITLDTKVDGDIELDVSEARSFKCRPGLIKNKNGVVITDSVKKGV